MYDGHQEGFVKTRLKRTKIRGVPSSSMVCSEKELGISEAHEGILFLPEDAPVGSPLADFLGDAILDISLTPNLARCLSVIGVAREVRALTGTHLRYPSLAWRTEGSRQASLRASRSWRPTYVRATSQRSSKMWELGRGRSGCRTGS